MAREFEFDPVDDLAVGTVGPVGQRAFYIQASDAFKRLTMLVEKFQVQAMAVRAVELLREEALEAEDAQDLREPVEPDFRAGEIGLGLDGDRHMVVLVAREASGREEDAEEEAAEAEDLSSARLWIRPAQMLGFAARALELVGQGRPLCPVCGLPMDPEGHACPRRNGKSPVF